MEGRLPRGGQAPSLGHRKVWVMVVIRRSCLAVDGAAGHGAGPGVGAADFRPVGRGKVAGHGFTRVLTRIVPATQHASRSGVPRILWAATRDELIELVEHNFVSCWRRSAAGSARSRPWRGIFGRFPGQFASLNLSLSSRPRHSTGITSYVRLSRIFVVSVRCVGVWVSRRGAIAP